MPILQNHIAVVTGSGSGIGRAIALGYAREGARVVLLDMNQRSATEAAQEIRSAGGKAESFALDVTQREHCVAVARQIADTVGQVSILVNNAGIARRNGMLGATEAVIKDWEDIIAINLTGVFNVTHAFLEPLRAAKGRIVNIGCRRTRQRRRARQCDRPGFYRNAAERKGARQQSGVGENIHRPHAARPRRPAGGYRGTGDFSGVGSVSLCHWFDRDGGWRVPDDLVTSMRAHPDFVIPGDAQRRTRNAYSQR